MAKVKSELRIPLVRTTTREARIIVTRNPALQKEAYTLNVTPGEGASLPLRLSVLTMRCNPCVFWRIMISAGVRCPAAAFTMLPVGVGAV